MTAAPLIQHLDEHGKLLSSFAKFLESAGPDDMWVISKILCVYIDEKFYLHRSSEMLESAALQVISIQADHRQSEQLGQPRDEFQPELFSHMNRVNFVLSALSMARNERDEELDAIYKQHAEALHDENVGNNRQPYDESALLKVIG